MILEPGIFLWSMLWIHSALSLSTISTLILFDFVSQYYQYFDFTHHTMPASWSANTSLFTSVQYWINVGTTGFESPLSALLLTAPYRNTVNQSHTIIEIKDIHPSARLDNSWTVIMLTQVILSKLGFLMD